MSAAYAQWLLRHGLPSWLVPGYWSLALLAAFLGAFLVLRQADHDGADRREQGYALIAVYVGALAGGYLLEWLRAVPSALVSASLSPILETGRAAYGGLLGGWLLSALYLRARRQPLAPFCDRSVILLGVAFGLVRLGCFLAGCDYGRVTSGPLGLRFPADSPAAQAHAALGWVPAHSPSLPVHPTQLYEVGLAAVATLLALRPLRQGRRDGQAFRVWLMSYAIGRFLLESLRGDPSRGLYLGLSSAQWLSLVIGLLVALQWWWPRAPGPAPRQPANLSAAPRLALIATLVMLLLPGLTFAKSRRGGTRSKPDAGAAVSPAPGAATTPAISPDAAKAGPAAVPTATPNTVTMSPTTQPPPTVVNGGPSAAAPPKTVIVVVQPGQTVQIVTAPGPTAAASGEPPPPAGSESVSEPATPSQFLVNQRRLGLRVTLGGMLPIARPEILAGGAWAIDGTYRIRFSESHRFEVGLELRGTRASDSAQLAVSVPLRAYFGLARHFELGVGFSPGYAHVFFDSSAFRGGANAFLGQLELGMQIPIASRLTIGFTPAAISILGGGDVRTFVSFEPRLWLGVSFW